MTRSLIVLPCLALAMVRPNAPPTSLTSRLATPSPPVWSDTSLAIDTTPPLLTTALLTCVAHFLAEVKQHPEQIRQFATASANVVHFKIQDEPFPGIFPDTFPGDVGAVLDYGALAAKVPAVAEAFRRAHLAPAQYLPFLKALTFAEATDTLQIALEGMQDEPVQPEDATSRIWANVAFLRAHRPAIDALGLTVPKITLRYNGGAQTHFLDTMALAQHRVRLREVSDTSAGFPIGFLDSTEAPAGASANIPAPPLRVLFIGNSLTYFNEMPRLFSALAAQGLHRRVVVGLVSVPAASPFALWIATDVRQVIATLPWDDIVVQLKPVGRNTQTNFQRYARLFTQQAAAHHAHTILWTQYRSPDTPVEDQVTLDSTLSSAATAVGARLAPIPAAWEAVQQVSDSTWHALYYDLANGNDHPSPQGSYLIALVVYRAITGQSPVGLPHQAGSVTIPERAAGLLQRAAAVQP